MLKSASLHVEVCFELGKMYDWSEENMIFVVWWVFDEGRRGKDRKVTCSFRAFEKKIRSSRPKRQCACKSPNLGQERRRCDKKSHVRKKRVEKE